MAFCGYCGKILYDGAAFCGFCGKKNLVSSDSNSLKHGRKEDRIKQTMSNNPRIIDPSTIPYAVDDNNGIVSIDGEMGQVLFVYTDRCVIDTSIDLGISEYDATSIYNSEWHTINDISWGMKFKGIPRKGKRIKVINGRYIIYYSQCKGIRAVNLGTREKGFLIFSDITHGDSYYFFDNSYGQIKLEMQRLFNSVFSQIPQPQYNAPPPIPRTQYYVVNNGEATGPFELREIKERISKGIIKKVSLLWKEGMEEWEMAMDIDELNELF